MNIAIDYDDTFTADPELWSAFVANATARGHQLYMITARRNTMANSDLINAMLDLWKCQMPIVFCSLGSKLHAVEQRGIKIGIWIDDDPEKLVRGH